MWEKYTPEISQLLEPLSSWKRWVNAYDKAFDIFWEEKCNELKGLWYTPAQIAIMTEERAYKILNGTN